MADLNPNNLETRDNIIQNMIKNKRNLVKRYGKDAEKVIYGRATSIIKKQTKEMKKDKLKEMVKTALMNPISELQDIEVGASKYEEEKELKLSVNLLDDLENKLKEADDLSKKLKELGYGKDVADVYKQHTPKTSKLNEDWGSSDEFAILQSMHKDLGTPTTPPSIIDVEEVAQDANDFYRGDESDYDRFKESITYRSVNKYYQKFFPEFYEGMKKMFSKNINEVEKSSMFVTGGSINPELRKKVEQFVKGVAKYYGYSVDDAFLAIMTILKGGLNENTTNELLYNPNETHGEFEVGDIVKYKDKDHEVTRIEPDRIYIRPTGTSMIGKLNHFWVKREDLNENTGLKKGDTVEFEGTKYKIGDFDIAGGANLVYLDTMDGKPAEDSKGSYLKVHATRVKPSMNEDIDLGHEDNEPHMIKGELYQIGKYAMELYAALEELEETGGEYDLPAWWQSKITTAKNNISGAKHYLEFELKEPAIDAAVDVMTGEEPYEDEPEFPIMEKELTKPEIKKKEEIIKGMKKSFKGPEPAMYAIATAKAKKLAENDLVEKIMSKLKQ
jgi:hypothetical protein